MAKHHPPNQNKAKHSFQSLKALEETIHQWDRYLERTYLATLSLNEARLLLDKVTQVMAETQAAVCQPDLPPAAQRLWRCLYRLSVDLSEKIQERLVDLLQTREREISDLNRQLKAKLQEQYLASRLLKQLQQIKHDQVVVGYYHGYEVVL